MDGDGQFTFESDWEKEYFLPTPCAFLVDNKCSIYPTRPNVCVAFDPDGDEHKKCLNYQILNGARTSIKKNMMGLGKSNMKLTQAFPTILIVLDVMAAIVYMCYGDWRKACYWLFAAGLTFVVTY